MDFNAEKVKNDIVEWIKDWFDKNGKGCKGVLGISGGKDSSVVAALLVEALGKENVVGVLVDPISGEIANNDTKNPTMFYYIKGTEPTYTNDSLESLIPTMKIE